MIGKNERRNMIPAQSLSTFFIHGGPGLSCKLERQLLGDDAPILWFDQAHISSATGQPYAALADAILEAFIASAERNGGQMRLLAHSFGAHPAYHILNKVPQMVSHFDLICPVYDLIGGFIRLSQTILTHDDMRNPALADALAAIKTERNKQSSWGLIQAILNTPNFTDLYWSAMATTQKQAFAQLLTDPAYFDFGTFEAVMNDVIDHPSPMAQSAYTGSVSLWFGRHDPLTDPATESTIWQSIYPQASSTVLDAGHFALMEECVEGETLFSSLVI
jgi:pimeloyl-ACP methyl ester carboxylesterase